MTKNYICWLGKADINKLKVLLSRFKYQSELFSSSSWSKSNFNVLYGGRDLRSGGETIPMWGHWNAFGMNSTLLDVSLFVCTTLAGLTHHHLHVFFVWVYVNLGAWVGGFTWRVIVFKTVKFSTFASTFAASWGNSLYGIMRNNRKWTMQSITRAGCRWEGKFSCISLGAHFVPSTV